MTTEVKELLAEGLESCQYREARAFDLAAAETDGIVLFGAGGLGRKALATLRAAGHDPVAFTDKNSSLWGNEIEGIPVLPPSEVAERYGRTAAFVVTIWASWNNTMLDQLSALKTLGCLTVIPFTLLAWKYKSTLLPHVQIDLPSQVHRQREDVLRCADLWCDEDSRREYAAQLHWRLFSDFNALRAPLPTPYWQQDLLTFGDHSVFVDVGAFNGDTVEEFINTVDSRFRRIYAFEPDGVNFRALQERIQCFPENVRSRISARQQAVSNYDGLIAFSGDAGLGSKVGGDNKVECVTLDTAIDEPPSYIKYDVEGFESEALDGSRNVIVESRPSLAVCAYHLQNHLWRLPLQIHSMNVNVSLR